jgi:hypothetical protein
MNNSNIKGASDLYEQLIEVKNGSRGCVVFSKKQAKELRMTWSFVEKSAQVLGLVISKAGQYGYNIGRT